MGLHIPDLYKRLQLMGDIDAIVAETAEQAAVHGLDLEEVRDAVAQDMFGAKSTPRRAQMQT
jgi:hypothetical protein